MTFKRIALGLAIFILTIVFIVFVNETINPKPKYQSCSSYPSGTYDKTYTSCHINYQNSLDTYHERSFMIITGLSILAIIAGVLVRSVAPVSWGLGMAGVLMIIYVFMASYQEIDKPYRAIISGLALVVLIWIAYAKLGDKDIIQASGEPISTDQQKT